MTNPIIQLERWYGIGKYTLESVPILVASNDGDRSQVDIVSILQEVFPGNDSILLDVNDALNRLEEFGAVSLLGE